jgi:hypothetical protein
MYMFTKNVKILNIFIKVKNNHFPLFIFIILSLFKIEFLIYLKYEIIKYNKWFFRNKEY